MARGRPCRDPLVYTNALQLVVGVLFLLTRRWYVHGAALTGSALASWAYHLSHERRFVALDAALARAACLTTIAPLLAADAACAAAAIATVPLAFACKHAGGREPRRYGACHSLWHVCIGVGQAALLAGVARAP